MYLSLDKSYSEEEEKKKKTNNINRCLGHQPNHLKNEQYQGGVRAVARTPNESIGSPLSEKQNSFEFGIFLHTLNGLRVHLPALQVAGDLSGNNTTL